MDTDFVFLTEGHAMWSDMLMQILQDNDIPCIACPVQSTHPAIYSGLPKGVNMFVPAHKKSQAEEILKGFFSNEESQQSQ